jgi:peroxiredoxin
VEENKIPVKTKLSDIVYLPGTIIHGPTKLSTVHLSDNTIIYESKVSVQNVFPDLKAPLCQDHTQNFRSIAHSSKKIETPKVYFIH